MAVPARRSGLRQHYELGIICIATPDFAFDDGDSRRLGGFSGGRSDVSGHLPRSRGARPVCGPAVRRHTRDAVTVPAMFHGRITVLPVVAIVAAIQEGQFGFNLSRCLVRDSKSSYICNRKRASTAPREQLVH